MTLRERLAIVKNSLTNHMVRIKEALLIKGVKTPEHMTYSLVADYIRQIYQEDFEFVFNFLDIDQFGSPHIPNTGQSIGGMIGITPVMDDLIIPQYSFTSAFGFYATISVSGHDYWSNKPPITVMADVELNALEEFNEQTVPEELNYDPTLQ